MRNVPRCWTYETAVAVGEQVKDDMPYNDYYEYFGPDYGLHLPVSNMENLNSREYLNKTKEQLLEILRGVEPVPSTQIVTGGVDSRIVPRGVTSMMDVDEHCKADRGNGSSNVDDPDQRSDDRSDGRKEHASEMVP